MTAVAASQHDVEQLFIGGQSAATASSETISICSPWSGDRLALIPAGCAEDVNRAVAAAREAAVPWGRTPLADRVATVIAMTDALEPHVEELARAQSAEMGQPLELARESLSGLSEWARGLLEGAPLAGVTELGGGHLVHEPRGVGALIVPWNFPLPVALQGLVPLLASGNTVVWKPSERSPLSAVAAMRHIAPVVPAGTVNLVLGDGRAGEPLAAHRDVDVIVFTGSVPTGRRVAALAADRLAKVVLELGGKDPVIVDEDVDPAWAAGVVAEGAMFNAGQLCTSMERIYVHAGIAEEFTAALCDAVRSVSIGPLVDRRQRAVVERHVKCAIDDGARVLVGGECPDGPGSHYPPTVVADVPQHTLLMREETFGPVAAVRTVESFDEAMQLANDTEFGLAATVLTSDPAHAQRAGSELRAGIVWINEWQGAVEGAQAEPQRLSGRGIGFGPGLWNELRTTRYVHRGSATPDDDAPRGEGAPAEPS